MKRSLTSVATAVALLMAGTHAALAAEQLSVLHWWTSGGESKAIRVLKDDMSKQGYEWKDFAIAGGAGAAAMTALKTQVISGNGPSAAQIKGPLIQDWAEQGSLVTIDQAATDWKMHTPAQIDSAMKAGGHYVAAPFSVHRINWLWINKADLDKVGGTPPTTWPEFFALADKFRAAGITPVAHGGQPWQDMTIWETVVLSQGADFYRKALVDLDQKTLTSPQMVQVFETVQKIRTYFDKGYHGRDWNLATAMVISGSGGMQFMGDWAKGEFANANKKADVDYICAAAPGTSNAYTYTADAFVFFQQNGKKDATPGQLALAKTIMSVDFQQQFSLYKGSIPVRLDVPMDKFDSCARKSRADEQATIKSGGFLPSLAFGELQSSVTAGAITDVVTNFMNSNEDAKEGARKLAAAAKVK
ncbi:ABC transporter substrate-binding protein [Paraburkholderia domus]|jgi:ABC-type sugar transport system, periplasmic component|uniref:ABC transporter substrate-binding protein n=1 Tax=Paraburkholderia domus TaxID=2793075 RepID=UPI00191248D0|nr:ABC transporter substrate-binding protein [Paraburkholderia domus]MBK5066318.1 carbohydrate ABC transporter substrate-binding protein [Burkholderia sp. R-70199]CAE6969282.1 putative sugar-binding periplasmic protein [Paraburkholderia domus]